MIQVKEKNEYKYLQAVPFSTWLNWDVKSYATNNLKSKYDFVKLGLVLNEQTEKVKLKDFPDQEFGILGVNNKIGIFDAYLEKGSKINQPYKIMKTNWIAYNPYRVNVGSVGIKTENQKYEYISNAYVVFSCQEEKLNTDFFFRLFKTNTFNNLVKKSTKGSVRQNLSFDLLSNIQIPLPPIPTQKSLVAKYDKELAEVVKLENKVNELNQKIEDYLLEELGITIVQKTKKKGLNFINFKDLDRWGVEYQLKEKSQFNNAKFPIKNISDFVEINPRNDFPKENTEASFVPMECVSDEEGSITELQNGNTKNSKGYTRFKENDLIWAKITPCMQNGKSAIAKNLKNGLGYGSTEFHTFREKEGANIEFFYHLFRSHYIRDMAMSYFTGTAGQQRVPASFFENLQMPIPSLDTQNKIAKRINEWKEEIKSTKNKSELLEIEAKKDFETNLFDL